MKHTESKLQENCVKWFRYAYPQWRLFLLAIPNGGRRDARTGALLKREGVIAGAPDLLLFCPFGEKLPLLIEMKRPDGKGRQSESQVEFMRTYRDKGYTYTVVDSFPKFEEVVMKYLTNGNL